MKTPDEIKKGLECCTVEYCYHTQKGCPYRDYSLCVQNVCEDALAYIQQLERERDAAVEVVSRYRNCDVCTHMNEGGLMCTTCKYPSLVDVYPTFRPNWQWRGPEVE